jgi:hypothetical protein
MASEQLALVPFGPRTFFRNSRFTRSGDDSQAGL